MHIFGAASGLYAVAVPEIARFLGITVTMYYDDHEPPHFHVRYGDHRAIIDIETMRLASGSLPPRVYGLVTEWATDIAPN